MLASRQRRRREDARDPPGLDDAPPPGRCRARGRRCHRRSHPRLGRARGHRRHRLGRRARPRGVGVSGQNRLAGETSPYLLQHAGNPVDWRPWGEEAFELARSLDRPVLLSVGYSACHWCHVMERESFEDEATAQLMNEHFVSIKVDREERPDVDGLYMSAVVSQTGQGGWPMTVFLLPDGRPFYGGTYFPPEARGGMPSFRQVLDGIAAGLPRAARRGRAPGRGARRDPAGGAARPAARGLHPHAGDAARRAAHAARPARRAQRRIRPRAQVPAALGAHVPAAHAPAQRQRGGARDGAAHAQAHGRRRHPRPARRRLPPLRGRCDLARAALRADALRQRAARARLPGRLAGDRRRAVARGRRGHPRLPAARARARARRLRLGAGRRHRRRRGPRPSPGLPSSCAPCSPRRMPRSPSAPGASLPTATSRARRCSRSSPRRRTTTSVPGSRSCAGSLLEARSARPQPALDDKALASWNGMALAALAEGARLCRRPDLLAAAERCAAFLLGPLSHPDGGLWRTHRAGRSQVPAFLDDYAQVAIGLYELYLTTREHRYLAESHRLALLARERFGAPDGSFFDTAHDAEELVARPRELDDNPTPSGNSTLAGLLAAARAHLRRARARAPRPGRRRAGRHPAGARAAGLRPPARCLRRAARGPARGRRGRRARTIRRRASSPPRCSLRTSPISPSRSETGRTTWAFRCSRGAVSCRAGRRSTCAADSSARRPRRTLTWCAQPCLTRIKPDSKGSST